QDPFDRIDDTSVLGQVIDLRQQEMRILVDRIQFRLVSAARLLGRCIAARIPSISFPSSTSTGKQNPSLS
ncbi:MAG: hypothetical protein VXY51_09040, partial [Pseudomonadota bacterium]|nr:hypothetical protein [Pseudomonadota bacterium]